jgi:GNAT superfamily N-acetyltransferase
MRNLEIRHDRVKDWNRICEIHDLARPLELKGSCDPRAFIPIGEDPEIEELRLCTRLIACKGKSILGFAGINEDYLAWLYVDPAFHGHGVGSMLLDASLDLIGDKKAWTIVLEGNETARRLYDKRGFKLIERFEGNNAGFACIGLRLSR